MWKSGICLRGATIFSPQTDCGILEVFHTACVEIFYADFSKSFSQLTFPQLTGGVDKFLSRLLVQWRCSFLVPARKEPKESGTGEALVPSPMYLSRSASP
jgi:hypothetical protein